MKVTPKNSWLVAMILVLAWTSICCKTQTASSQAQLNQSATPNSVVLQESKFEKVSERPVRDMLGCFMTLHFANENVGWMSCLGYLWKTSDGGRNWQEIYYAGNDRLPDYYFVNSSIVWAMTLHDLQKSEDGGATWKAVSPPLSGERITLDDIEFLKDGQHGWLAASNYVGCPPEVRNNLGVHSLSPDGKRCLKGYIFYTEDGGESWRKQPFDSKLGSSIGLRMTQESRVWAFHNLHVYYLADGQWIQVDYTKGRCKHESILETIDFYQQTFEPSGPVEIFFVGNTGWLSFSNGYLAKSTDGGRTWCDLFDLKTLTDDFRISSTKLYFSDVNNGWGLADNIYETKDGGSTWKKIETNMGFEDMHFLDATHGWAISKEGLYRIKQ